MTSTQTAPWTVRFEFARIARGREIGGAPDAQEAMNLADDERLRLRKGASTVWNYSAEDGVWWRGVRGGGMFICTPQPAWVVGSNVPGFLSDTTEPATPVTWDQARQQLQNELEHEADLIDTDLGPIEDANHLRECSERLDLATPDTAVEISANDATGQVRVFFLQLAE